MDICIYTTAFIWRFVSLDEFVQVYRCIRANKARFSAEYAAAKARGDERVTLTGGSLAPFEMSIYPHIDRLDHVMDEFMAKMRPFVMNYLLNATYATTTAELYTSLMIKAEWNDIDSELHLDLATSVLNDGADEARRLVLAEQTAMMARVKHEYEDHMARLFREALALELPTYD